MYISSRYSSVCLYDSVEVPDSYKDEFDSIIAKIKNKAKFSLYPDNPETEPFQIRCYKSFEYSHRVFVVFDLITRKGFVAHAGATGKNEHSTAAHFKHINENLRRLSGHGLRLNEFPCARGEWVEVESFSLAAAAAAAAAAVATPILEEKKEPPCESEIVSPLRLLKKISSWDGSTELPVCDWFWFLGKNERGDFVVYLKVNHWRRFEETLNNDPIALFKAYLNADFPVEQKVRFALLSYNVASQEAETFLSSLRQLPKMTWHQEEVERIVESGLVKWINLAGMASSFSSRAVDQLTDLMVRGERNEELVFSLVDKFHFFHIRKLLPLMDPLRFNEKLEGRFFKERLEAALALSHQELLAQLYREYSDYSNDKQQSIQAFVLSQGERCRSTPFSVLLPQERAAAVASFRQKKESRTYREVSVNVGKSKARAEVNHIFHSKAERDSIMYFLGDTTEAHIQQFTLSDEELVPGPDTYPYFFYKVMKGNLQKVSTLLDRGFDPNKRYRDGGALLHTLCFSKNPHSVAIARLLCDHGADLEQVDDSSLTPLMWAVSTDNLEMVRAYLNKGADPNHCTYSGNQAISPLDLATVRLREPMIHLLIERGAKAGNGPSVLLSPLFSTSSSHVKFRNVSRCESLRFKKLLKQKKVAGHKFIMGLGQPPYYFTANSMMIGDPSVSFLEVAIEKRRLDIVKCMLDAYPVTPNHKALFKACQMGYEEAVILLEEYGSDLRYTDVAGKSAVNEAMKANQGKLAKAITIANAEKRPLREVLSAEKERAELVRLPREGGLPLDRSRSSAPDNPVGPTTTDVSSTSLDIVNPPLAASNIRFWTGLTVTAAAGLGVLVVTFGVAVLKVISSLLIGGVAAISGPLIAFIVGGLVGLGCILALAKKVNAAKSAGSSGDA